MPLARSIKDLKLCAIVVAKGLLERSPCEGEHPFWVGSKDLEGFRRTSKDVFSCYIEPGEPLQPVSDCSWFLIAKRVYWVCGGVEDIGVDFQQRSVSGIRTAANYCAIFRSGKPAIYLRCLRISW